MSVRRGLTLVELLCVVAVVGVLMALLIPAVGMVRGACGRRRAQSNLRQIGVACLAYSQDHRDQLPADRTFGDDNPRTSPAWFHRLRATSAGRTCGAASSSARRRNARPRWCSAMPVRRATSSTTGSTPTADRGTAGWAASAIRPRWCCSPMRIAANRHRPVGPPAGLGGGGAPPRQGQHPVRRPVGARGRCTRQRQLAARPALGSGALIQAGSARPGCAHPASGSASAMRSTPSGNARCNCSYCSRSSGSGCDQSCR